MNDDDATRVPAAAGDDSGDAADLRAPSEPTLDPGADTEILSPADILEAEPPAETEVLAAIGVPAGDDEFLVEAETAELAQEPEHEVIEAETTVVPLAAVETETAGESEAPGEGRGDTPEAVAEPGLLDEMPEEANSGRGRKALTAAGIALLVLGGAYVGGVLYTADRTPPNTTVSGVEVGGMSSEAAVATLAEAFGPRETDPLALEIGDVEATIKPVDAGLSFDGPASVAQVTGHSWDPRVLWERLTGTVAVDAVTHVDKPALEEQLDEAAEFVAVAPQDAVIVFADGRAVVTPPVDGSGLDVPGAVEVISAGWLTGQEPLVLPLAVVTPELDQAAVDTAMATIVDPMLSAPVTLQAGDEQLTIDPLTLTQVATLPGEGGKFVLAVDPEALMEVVNTGLPDLGGEPKDASFAFVGGVPTVVPAVDGTGVDAAQVAAAVAAAAVEPTGRVAVAEFVTREPQFTTEQADALGTLQVVGEFSTPMPYDPPRTENLVIGTSRINGTVVMPGEQFSLLKTIGPISLANGYNTSLGVDGGLVVQVAGGGLSQLSTTTFNAAYEAGMQDIFHRPHTRWFDRYPAGREATVDDPSLDMIWENNTPYPVLMQAGVSDNRTWVKLWSVPYWDVTIVSGEKHSYTDSRTIYNTDSTCRAESGGTKGFTISVTRTVSHDGVVDEAASGTDTWTYTAWPRVVCGPDPATQPRPAPTPAPTPEPTPAPDAGGN